MLNPPYSPVFEQLGFKHNLKYGPRSKLRRACSRFLRFSYLLDFLAMEALANIYVRTVQETQEKLHEQTMAEVDLDIREGKVGLAEGAQPKRRGLNLKNTPLF